MKKLFKYILAGAMLALLAVGIAACHSGEERLSAPTNLTLSGTEILS